MIKSERPRALRIQQQPDGQDAAGEVLQDVAGYVRRIWGFFKALDLGQQLVVGGAAAVLVGLFLPWVSDNTKDYLGLEVDGLLLLLLAGGAVASVVLRRTSASWAEPARARVLLYGQLGASVLGALFVLLQMSRPLALVDPDPRLPPQMMHASLQFGIVLSLAASAVVLAGCIMELKQMLSPGAGD